MEPDECEQLRRHLVALKRSVDPHISDARKVEILRSDFDPIWAALVAMVEPTHPTVIQGEMFR